MAIDGHVVTMNRRRPRPRPLSSAQLSMAVVATLSTTLPLPSEGFVMPSVACLFAAFHRTNRNIKSSTAIAAAPPAARRRGRLGADPRQQRRHRERQKGGDGGRSRKDILDPDDPLPHTMEELYRRIAVDPPVDSKEQYQMALEPKPEEMNIIEEAVRATFKCTEDNAWWEANEEEWDRMAESPGKSFALGLDDEARAKGKVWGMEDYFGEETPDWGLLDEAAAPFSLSAYKAGGVAGLPEAVVAVEGGGAEDAEQRKREAAALFGRTPFSQYWESVPDLGTSGRVYAYNAVDRMAALKFMMNCTYNGMHGPAENLQSGHFLWGYVDQLDWMRRSGRLSSTPGSVKVDPSSWWGRVSFALTIVPLAAAVESGVWQIEGTPAVSILGLGMGGERQGQKDDLKLPEMRRAMRAWKRVWCFEDPDIASRVLLDMPVHDSLQERIRRVQWAAHLESLDAVEALYGEEFNKLPSKAEREFARGWCRAARLFAEAAAHTDLDRCLIPLGAGYAPERILVGDDDDDDTVPSATASVDKSQPLESVPYGPPDLIAEAENDPVVALNTRRCVASVRWLGTLPVPVFGTLRRLWRRSCASYPARRAGARVLRKACYGGWGVKSAAWGKAFLLMFVPNLNYRKLTFPLGVDPAEEVEYDPEFKLYDLPKPSPRPAGSLPLNPLQWPWYNGRRPDPSAGLPGAAWGEDDDGLLESLTAGGMFPPGEIPVDGSFEARQRREREIMEDLRAAKERQTSATGSDDNGEVGRRGKAGSDVGGGLNITHDAVAEPEEGEGARLADNVFM